MRNRLKALAVFAVVFACFVGMMWGIQQCVQETYGAEKPIKPAHKCEYKIYLQNNTPHPWMIRLTKYTAETDGTSQSFILFEGTLQPGEFHCAGLDFEGDEAIVDFMAVDLETGEQEYCIMSYPRTELDKYKAKGWSPWFVLQAKTTDQEARFYPGHIKVLPVPPKAA